MHKMIYYLFITLIFVWVLSLWKDSNNTLQRQNYEHVNEDEVYAIQNAMKESFDISPRKRRDIIKGKPAGSKYPFTVSLLNYNNRQEWQICGGVLIAPNVILSAAHCFNQVKLVEIFFNSEESEKIYIPKQNKLMHPKYDPKTTAYDFMLIKISSSYSSDYVIKINSEESIPIGDGDEESLLVLGWGLTNQNDRTSASKELLKASVSYVETSHCRRFYGNMVTDSMLCAHSVFGRDSCNGDSGGPLILETATEKILVGIVSWGASCGHPQYPGVYGRISMAHSWITQVICGEWNPETCDNQNTLKNQLDPAVSELLDNTNLALTPPQLSSEPSFQPSLRTSNQPSSQPSSQLSFQPSSQTSNQPSKQPSYPSTRPTLIVLPDNKEDDCKDAVGTFSVNAIWYYIGVDKNSFHTCAWVKSIWFGCWLYSEFCPQTCFVDKCL